MRKVILTLMVSMALVLSAQAQKTISGKVTDANGSPISNVSVMVRGTTTGTTTDLDGNYYISVPNNQTVLLFQYIGFKSQEIEVGKLFLYLKNLDL